MELILEHTVSPPSALDATALIVDFVTSFEKTILLNRASLLSALVVDTVTSFEKTILSDHCVLSCCCWRDVEQEDQEDCVS
jgi:hypothetical protein